jgi:hypothetical protein
MREDDGTEVRSGTALRMDDSRLTGVSDPDSGTAERARIVALSGAKVRSSVLSGVLERPRTDVPREVSLRELSGLISLISLVAVLLRLVSVEPGVKAPSALRVVARLPTLDSLPLRIPRLRMAGTSRTASRSSDTFRI